MTLYVTVGPQYTLRHTDTQKHDSQNLQKIVLLPCIVDLLVFGEDASNSPLFAVVRLLAKNQGSFEDRTLQEDTTTNVIESTMSMLYSETVMNMNVENAALFGHTVNTVLVLYSCHGCPLM